MEYTESIHLRVEPGNEDTAIFEHEVKFAIRLGTKHAFINQIAPKQELYDG
jgi:hypothetical protein